MCRHIADISPQLHEVVHEFCANSMREDSREQGTVCAVMVHADRLPLFSQTATATATTKKRPATAAAVAVARPQSRNVPRVGSGDDEDDGSDDDSDEEEDFGGGGLFLELKDDEEEDEDDGEACGGSDSDSDEEDAGIPALRILGEYDGNGSGDTSSLDDPGAAHIVDDDDESERPKRARRG